METLAASTSSRETQLEEARDQLLLLLRRSDDDALRLKAEADASRSEAGAERRRLLARVNRERESIRHQAKLGRLALEHRWQLSESALLAALRSRDDSIRRLEGKQAELLERLQDHHGRIDSREDNFVMTSGSDVETGTSSSGEDRAAASTSAAGMGDELSEKAQGEKRSTLADRNLQLTRALEDAERLRALAEERLMRREEEMQERVEELLEQAKAEHTESAAVEAVTTLAGAAEKLRAEMLEDRVEELTRELNHAEECLRGGGVPVPRDQSAMSLFAELQERCAVSEAAESRALRENVKLEAQIEQLEKSLEAAVKEQRQRTARLEDELHVVCTWANSIEQEYERDFALLEQDYAYLEQFAPEEVRKQLNQSNMRGSSSSSLRPPVAPSSAASTPVRSSQKRASLEGLPPPSPFPPGGSKFTRQRVSSEEERPVPEQQLQQQGQQEELALVPRQTAADKALQSALSWSSDRSLSAPSTPRCRAFTENPQIQRQATRTQTPGRNRNSGEGQVGRLDAMYSTVQQRAKQALTEQLEDVTAQLSKAEATVTEKDEEIQRLKCKLQGGGS